jgi:hypothetical protein
MAGARLFDLPLDSLHGCGAKHFNFLEGFCAPAYAQGAPLFLLCFAAANPNAVTPTIKLAQDILKRDPVLTPMLLPPGDCSADSIRPVELGFLAHLAD